MKNIFEQAKEEYTKLYKSLTVRGYNSIAAKQIATNIINNVLKSQHKDEY